MSENYDWKKDPFLHVDSALQHEQLDIEEAIKDAVGRRFSQCINQEAANANKVDELFGRVNVYVKTAETGDKEYDARVKIGDRVVFTRLGYRAQSIDDMDGQVKIVVPNDVIYTVVGKNPPVYGSVSVKSFGPAHKPIGPRIGEAELAATIAKREHDQSYMFNMFEIDRDEFDRALRAMRRPDKPKPN